MKHVNPYTSITGINVPRMFFDRIDLVEDLLDALLADSSQCRSIIGQRKIGKTSILQQIIQSAETLNDSTRSYRCIFIYFDCQYNVDALESIETFYRSLLDLLYDSVPKHLQEIVSKFKNNESGAISWKVWRENLKVLKDENIKVVVIFDEFDKVIFRQNLHEEGLFGTLRSLPQFFSNFVWVTSTHRQLRDLFAEAWKKYGISDDQKKIESEFYNIAPTIGVSLFDNETIASLILEPSSLTGVQFAPDEIEKIKSLGGYFPYYIQRACYHFYNNHVRNNNRIETVVQDYFQEVFPLWEDLWDSQNPRSKRIITAIAYDRDTKAGEVEVNELIAASLVHEDNNGRLSLFSEEFSRFVQRKNQGFENIIQENQINQWVDHERYKILNLIDATPSSQVVKVWDERWANTKAIKFLRIGDDTSEGTAQRLQKSLRREAKILVKLDHPRIGKVFDIIDAPIGIVMEWVDGSSLKEFIELKNRLPAKKIIEIGIQVADALSYIHHPEHAVIHRDVKPANIIFTPEEKIKLIDFGIAHDVYVETISYRDDGGRFQIGTPRYSSPEQLMLDDIGPLSDIFSLGVVLYELFTFERPFKYGNRLTQYSENVLPMPDPFDIPNSVYNILCKMLDGKLSERPTAEVLKLELQKCLQELQSPS